MFAVVYSVLQGFRTLQTLKSSSSSTATKPSDHSIRLVGWLQAIWSVSIVGFPGSLPFSLISLLAAPAAGWRVPTAVSPLHNGRVTISTAAGQSLSWHCHTAAAGLGWAGLGWAGLVVSLSRGGLLHTVFPDSSPMTTTVTLPHDPVS